MRSLRTPVLAAMCLLVGLAGSLTAQAQTLRIFHIDVDQADATLFVSPGGNTLLIDSGKNGHGSRIRAVMQQAGVTQIDFFVATHYHEDHYGGIDELTQAPAIPIAQAFDRGDKQFLPASKTSGDRYVEYHNAVGNGATHLTRGQTIPLEPGVVTVTCVSSGGVVLAEEPPVTGHDENDMSISLLIQLGAFRYFVGVDIHAATENKIAARDLVLDVDVYQADHHGSDTSSAEAFIEDLIPTVIVISNGNHGRNRHPRQSTLDAYSSLTPAPTVFQTNKYLKGGTGGNVADQFIADLVPDGAEGTITMTVNPATRSYTVAYRDQSHTFQIKTRGGPRVVIESVLPNPVGSDADNEEVTLRNTGTFDVSLAQWRLQDESGRIWPLVSLGTLGANQSATMRRNRMPMSLNNSGDVIVLVDGNDTEQDRFAYNGSAEGVVIQTGH